MCKVLSHFPPAWYCWISFQVPICHPGWNVSMCLVHFLCRMFFYLKNIYIYIKEKNKAKKKKYIFVLPSTLVCDLCRFSSLLTLRSSPGYCRREKSGKGEPVPFLKPKSHLTPCFGVNGFCLWPPTSIKQDSYGDTQWVLRTSPPRPQITSIPTASWAHLDIRKKAVWSFILKCEHHSPQTLQTCLNFFKYEIDEQGGTKNEGGSSFWWNFKQFDNIVSQYWASMLKVCLLACLFLVYGSGLGFLVSVDVNLTWKLGYFPMLLFCFFF